MQTDKDEMIILRFYPSYTTKNKSTYWTGIRRIRVPIEGVLALAFLKPGASLTGGRALPRQGMGDLTLCGFALLLFLRQWSCTSLLVGESHCSERRSAVKSENSTVLAKVTITTRTAPPASILEAKLSLLSKPHRIQICISQVSSYKKIPW